MKIVVDSCCDMTPDLLARTGAKSVPLTITIEGKDYIDDGSVEIVPYLEAMKASREPTRSACPSPMTFCEAMNESEEDCFAVTLSSKLSGSYNAAKLGCDMALDDQPEKRIHVFDSESASAGETYITLMIDELIKAGKTFDEIVSAVSKRIESLHTLFVLDSLDNFIKNGRIPKTIGALIGLMSIRLVLSDDGHGNIKPMGKARGLKNAHAKMVDVIKSHTEGLPIGSQRLVLCYCNCLESAQNILRMIREKCPAIGEIIMVPTGALSSMYAYDGGVVIAY